MERQATTRGRPAAAAERGARAVLALAAAAVAALALAAPARPAAASDSSHSHPVYLEYEGWASPPAPRAQTEAEAEAKSVGCKSCHTDTDLPTMHANRAVVLGCTDCHGGKGGQDHAAPAEIAALGAGCRDDERCLELLKAAHVPPRFPKAWDWPRSRMPERTYTLLNYESPAFIRFINPGDNRVAPQACGACHAEIVTAVQRSLMSNTAMLWGGAAYNNGIVPFKRYILGEGYFVCDPEVALAPCRLEAELVAAEESGVAIDAREKRGLREACEEARSIWEIGEPSCQGALPGASLPARYADPVSIAAAVESETQREVAQVDAADDLAHGILPSLLPLPRWETIPPADNFRVFERGGRFIKSQFPEIGLPNPLEDPGKPDLKQSNRGAGTGSRISVPVLNIHKTRLNDPTLWFLGTSDHPGDYRASGCTSCHTPYANDRELRHSGPLARFGNMGETATSDPTIPKGESGHPLRHEFTRAVPTSQCMICHMHQPNMFVNSYLGYTMWDYEPDAHLMWPEEQVYPTIAEKHAALEANPEAAVVRGKWRDIDFLRDVWTDVNPKATATQFADYHGHGWNFRAIYKRSRDGTLLDADGHPVSDDDPRKFEKAVHLRDIHAEMGMQCADCHFAQDAHGRGVLDQEVAAAVEIRCQDCHGTIDMRAPLRTSGPAAPRKPGCRKPGEPDADGKPLCGHDLAVLRNPDGRLRFEWRDGKLFQRPLMACDPTEDACRRVLEDSPGRYLTEAECAQLQMNDRCEWEVKQVRDSVDPASRGYNPKAARAKKMARGSSQAWDEVPARSDRAHDDEEMACFACHSSWMTGCAGCHLPIEANRKTPRHHYEGGETRNFATYNPQVARDEFYILGKHGQVKDHIVAPVRSSSALVLSSTDINRNRIYVQQGPVSAAGFSAQAFAPHFPHTVRKTETKGCDDCHLSAAGDNNAIMAQLLGLGTSFVNFVGLNAWVGTESAVEGIQVTEWEEPQAVMGSYLHRYAFPDFYAAHVAGGRKLQGRETFGGKYSHHANQVRCLQIRGEYLYAAEGENGTWVYDVASIANKNFSERILTAPFSLLGQDIHIESANATCVALPTNQPIRPERNVHPHDPVQEKLMREANLEQVMHPIYGYAAITDAEEGLILSNVVTMGDFEPRNNFLHRDVVWNPPAPDGSGPLLAGATYATFAGHILYVAADRGIVVVDVDDPFQPRHLATVPLAGARAMMVQFRYLFAVDAEGLKVVDVTFPEKPRVVEGAAVPIADAHRIFVARTYAYVAAGREGLVIVDVTRPTEPREYMRYDAGGEIRDARDVVVATTNASLFAYVADGEGGLKVLQLTSPEIQPKFYGFSPEPKPTLIAWRDTDGAALALSRGLERDRAVDETGYQIAIFGRVGSRPFNLREMRDFFLTPGGEPWLVEKDAGPATRAR